MPPGLRIVVLASLAAVVGVAALLPAAADEPLYRSAIVSADTPGHAVSIDIEVRGAQRLYLIVEDAGDGYGCDWADWLEPRLTLANGETIKLVERRWKSARTDWGTVGVNVNAAGNPLRVAGKVIDEGIGTHANSVIVYELPANAARFTARGALDDGGTDQGCGSTVRFTVSTTAPGSPPGLVAREPENAVAQLDAAAGVDVSLFAAEPMLLSPSNIDVDHRGRVWVCEIVNYRGHRNRRPEGDRILILEDVDGDGAADESTVFHQGRDIDSIHGVCVLATPNGPGTRVIASAGEHVFVFEDTDGDDRADKRTILFSGIGGTQHDHGIHAFIFGPDGKLYFTFGNSGHQLRDAGGNIVVDGRGREVRANGKPYRQGMVFRCDLDGTNVETLGHNFRNNWMATVDSFGTVWQSDNDDDGNRGVRINYVMQYGNYGYVDEKTGAGWRASRPGMAQKVPERHWHLNDPGVVPTLLLTGAGSPTGITVYEGDLLPAVFRNQVLHADAGPNVVRAYPVTDAGAGYTARMENLLVGTRDQWFRPSDVTVAPDGSVIVADWYDPGVGGHAMGDLERGRLFRLTPKGHRGYRVPSFDFTTAAGAVEALKNPSYAVRAIAWLELHAMGRAAEPELEKLWQSTNPRWRARALWLLGKIEGRGAYWVETAIADADPNLRITGVRLAQQLDDVDLGDVIAKLVRDPSPQVRRECAVHLPEIAPERAALLWTVLALRYDGHDRWYLEALGIGAEGNWDASYVGWRENTSEDLTWQAEHGIVWRSRSREAAKDLAGFLFGGAVAEENVDRMFRAFDFHDDAVTDAVLSESLERHGAEHELALKALDHMTVGAIRASKPAMATLTRALADAAGTRRYVELVRRFELHEHGDTLLSMALDSDSLDTRVAAADQLLRLGMLDFVNAVLTGPDSEAAARLLQPLGFVGRKEAIDPIEAVVMSTELDRPRRVAAVEALGSHRSGERRLLAIVEKEQLHEDLRIAAANELLSSGDGEIRRRASKHLQLPQSFDEEPLPPISELLKLTGDVERGKLVYQNTCRVCHPMQGVGFEIGPALDEIGDKLPKQALYQSILDPSAGITVGYEAYSFRLADGEEIEAVIVSKTAEQLEVRVAEGVTLTLDRRDVRSRKQLDRSLMPADLTEMMTQQELVDLIEYMTTLRR